MSFAHFISALIVMLAVSARAAAAEAPVVMTHVGQLLESDDDPVTNPALSVLFRIFSSESPSVELPPVWSAECVLEVNGGRYSVLLGGPGCEGDGLDTSDLPLGAKRYLEVSVAGQALLPRMLVSSVPTAQSAGDAQRLGGVAAESYALKTDVAPDSLLLAGHAPSSSAAPDAVPVLGGDGRLAFDMLPGVMFDAQGRLAEQMLPSPLEADVLGGFTPSQAPTPNAIPVLDVQGRLPPSMLPDDLAPTSIGGVPVTEFVTQTTVNQLRTDLDGAGATNLINGGGFENFTSDTPHWWAITGGASPALVGLARSTDAYSGASSVQLTDSDLNGTPALEQVAVESAAGFIVSSPFTLSVRYLRKSGSAVGELCLEDAPGSHTCVTLDGAGQWEQAVVTHQTSASPQYLKATLRATLADDPGGTAAYVFDEAMLARGTLPVAFSPSTQDGVPAGLIAFFSGACPRGFVEFEAARGRTIVATSPFEDVGSTRGSALSSLGTRTITEVPRHHHSINPPATDTTSSSHSHSYGDYYYSDTGNTPEYSTSSGDDVGERRSATRTTSSHTHKHSLNITAFDSAETGSSSVDVTMPYIQLVACQAL